MRLKVLNLNRNRVGDEGACALGIALQRSCGMHELHIQHNAIRESGAVALAVALKNNETLDLVDVRGNRFVFVRMKLKSILKDCPETAQFICA
jgi:Ran GTPase-activating protein (RanGAP) involved in mRNA processing and transport